MSAPEAAGATKRESSAQWILSVLALPAALQLLGRLADTLELNDLIDRLARSWRSLTEELWRQLLSPFPDGWREYPTANQLDAWTLAALLFLASFGPKVTQDRRDALAWASIASATLIVVVFAAPAVLAWVALDWKAVLFVAGICAFGLGAGLIYSWREMRHWKTALTVLLVIVNLAGMFVLAMGRETDSSWETALNAAIFFLPLYWVLILLVASNSMRLIQIVTYFVVLIFADWLLSILLPFMADVRGQPG